MHFSSAIVAFSLLACFLVGPIAVFMVKPNASPQKKAAKLLLPIIIFFLTIASTSLLECFSDKSLGCLAFKGFFLCIGTLWFTMYLGWFEYIWRRIHKQILWPLKENLKYGVISNVVLCVSAIMTVFFVLISLDTLPLLFPLIDIN